MRILILGASDSEGTLLANFADSWRERLRTELPDLLGEPVEVFHKRFYAHLPGTLDYLERCIAETSPDFVIAPFTAFAFSTLTVGNRLRRLLGRRAGDWFERRFTTFDAATSAAEQGWKHKSNEAAHRAAATLIGREAISTYEQVFGTYRQSIERIARIEDADAIIMGSTYNGPDVQRRQPKIRGVVDHFNGELRATAEKHRFGFIDRQAIISSLDDGTPRPDQMHTGPEVHAGYAEALKTMIVARTRVSR